MYDYRHLGFNYRMTDFTARLARTQLARLDDGNTRRPQIAARYHSGLEGIEQVRRPEIPTHGHALHQYALRVERRDALRQALSRAGIGTQVYYPKPLTTLPHLGSHPDRGRVPRADRLCADLVSIPIHARLSDDDIDYVVEQTRTFYR